MFTKKEMIRENRKVMTSNVNMKYKVNEYTCLLKRK